MPDVFLLVANGAAYWGDERRRPDRLGLVFGVGPYGKNALIVQCHEVWPGAADTGTSGRYYLDKLTRKHAVALYRTDRSAFMLPTWEAFEYTREDEIWDTPLWADWLEKFKNCGLAAPQP